MFRMKSFGASAFLFVLFLLPQSALASGSYAWTQTASPAAHAWNSITSSSDGTKLAAVARGGDIYTSTDGGTTWTDRTTAGLRNWQSIASSADGTKLAAAVGGPTSG